MLSCTPLTPSLSKNCVNVFVTNPKFLVNEYFNAGGSGAKRFAGFNTRAAAPNTAPALRSKSGG